MNRAILFFALLVACLASTASAQIELIGGYSNLHFAGNDKNLQNVDGFGVDLRAETALIPLPVLGNFRFGSDVGWRRYNTAGTGTDPFTPDKSDLDLFTGELRVAYRQPIGHLFIEPSLNGGALVGTYSTRNHFDLTNFKQTAVGWTVRPEVAVGLHIAFVTLGLDGSYRFGNINFHNGVGGAYHEWYAGAFAGISF